MLPAFLRDISRSRIGRYAVYGHVAWNELGLWRGFSAEPHLPQHDLVVVVRPADHAQAAILREQRFRDRRWSVDADGTLLWAARPAHRGVTLREILVATAEQGAVPPAALPWIVLGAGDPSRSFRGCRPEEIVVSWAGAVLLDGVDPAIVDHFAERGDRYAHLADAVEACAPAPRPDAMDRALHALRARDARTAMDIAREAISEHDRQLLGELAVALFPAEAQRDRVLLDELGTLTPADVADW